jgi:hypothetical protein
MIGCEDTDHFSFPTHIDFHRFACHVPSIKSICVAVNGSAVLLDAN